MLTKITSIVSQIACCPVDKVVPEASLQDLGLDSLKVMVVLFEIEEVYDIDIPNEAISDIKTVNGLIKCTEKLYSR